MIFATPVSAHVIVGLNASSDVFLEGKLDSPTLVQTPEDGEVLYFPRLYTFDNDGRVREWHMEIKGSCHRTSTGLYGGKLMESGWTQCEAKNKGKKHATTAAQQAWKEVEGLYKKKLKQNWQDIIPNKLDWKVRYFEPMLAQNFKDHKDDMVFPVLHQPKLDGHRCIARKDGLWTRKGEKYASVPHIEEALAPFFETYPQAILDGELYNHDLKDDFNEIASILRKTKELTPAQAEHSKNFAQYHIYDALSDVDDARGFLDRFSFTIGGRVVTFFGENHPYIRFVMSNQASDLDELNEAYEAYLEQGYEGQMIRLDARYQIGGRSKSLLKRKEFEDAEFEIVSITAGLGNWAGRAKSCTVKLPNGKTGSAGMRGKKSYLKQVLKEADSYVGKLATVQFFGYTKDGKLRFATVKQLDPLDK
jgi:DNA ligase-1